MLSDTVTETASAASTKLGRLEVAGRRLMVCQELLRFFKGLEREGVGTRSLESKARKIAEERCSKNLGGTTRPEKQVHLKLLKLTEIITTRG